MMVSTARRMLYRCVEAHGIRYFLMFGQVNQTEMHERFDKAGDVTRSEAEAIRKAVRAEGERLRQAVMQVRRRHLFATMSP